MECLIVLNRSNDLLTVLCIKFILSSSGIFCECWGVYLRNIMITFDIHQK